MHRACSEVGGTGHALIVFSCISIAADHASTYPMLLPIPCFNLSHASTYPMLQPIPCFNLSHASTYPMLPPIPCVPLPCFHLSHASLLPGHRQLYEARSSICGGSTVPPLCHPCATAYPTLLPSICRFLVPCSMFSVPCAVPL